MTIALVITLGSVVNFTCKLKKQLFARDQQLGGRPRVQNVAVLYIRRLYGLSPSEILFCSQLITASTCLALKANLNTSPEALQRHSLQDEMRRLPLRRPALNSKQFARPNAVPNCDNKFSCRF